MNNDTFKMIICFGMLRGTVSAVIDLIKRGNGASIETERALEMLEKEIKRSDYMFFDEEKSSERGFNRPS